MNVIMYKSNKKLNKSYLKIQVLIIVIIIIIIAISKQEDYKESYKILTVTDIHNDIDKVKILVDKINSTKFDFVFLCGDIVDFPIEKNDSKKMKEYFLSLKNIFKELERLGHILWVPGNHEYISFFKTKHKKEICKNCENLHKKIKEIGENLYVVGLGGSLPVMKSSKGNHNNNIN